jgi:hypothetical protein
MSNSLQNQRSSSREASISDIPELARRWYLEKDKTCYAKLDIEWSEAGCAAFLTEIIDNPEFLVLIASCNSHVTAAIGCNLYCDWIPPHPLVGYEWMWWGDKKRDVVALLHRAMEWAKIHDAVLFKYILNVPGKSATKFTETYRWEVL